MLSTTGQLCDVKGFHNSYEAITNVLVGKAATAVVHDDGTVYNIILNENLLFAKSIDHSLIIPNQIKSFGIPVSDNPFARTWEFGIDHEDMFIIFRTECTTVSFNTYVPSYQKLETCAHIVLTYGEVEWEPEIITMVRNMLYRYK